MPATVYGSVYEEWAIFSSIFESYVYIYGYMHMRTCNALKRLSIYNIYVYLQHLPFMWDSIEIWMFGEAKKKWIQCNSNHYRQTSVRNALYLYYVYVSALSCCWHYKNVYCFFLFGCDLNMVLSERELSEGVCQSVCLCLYTIWCKDKNYKHHIYANDYLSDTPVLIILAGTWKDPIRYRNEIVWHFKWNGMQSMHIYI